MADLVFVRRMKIQADIATIYSLRNEPAPEGVVIEPSGGATKVFDTHLNINLDVAETIKAAAIASWVVAASIASLWRGKKMYVNGKMLAPDEAGATKMVTDIVDAEQKENQSRQ